MRQEHALGGESSELGGDVTSLADGDAQIRYVTVSLILDGQEPAHECLGIRRRDRHTGH